MWAIDSGPYSRYWAIYLPRKSLPTLGGRRLSEKVRLIMNAVVTPGVAQTCALKTKMIKRGGFSAQLFIILAAIKAPNIRFSSLGVTIVFRARLKTSSPIWPQLVIDFELADNISSAPPPRFISSPSASVSSNDDIFDIERYSDDSKILRLNSLPLLIFVFNKN